MIYKRHAMVKQETQHPGSDSDRMTGDNSDHHHHRHRRHRRSARGLARDIDKYTKQGTVHITAGQLHSALEDFELAHKRALQLKEAFPIRACAFNLGAVYIATGQPAKGLEILHQALPPQDQQDEKSNGDLFYNFALGYEALNNPTEAVRYLELALEEYQNEKDNYKMEAEITNKMADIYTNLHQWLPAARANGIGSRAYAMLADYENQAVMTCHEAACLFQGNRPDLALQIADDCMLLCQKVQQQSDSLSKLYNELGLTYTQCHDFGKAATCFELALPLSRGPNGDPKQSAVILQNLGAVYNSLGDFQRAISFHEAAAKQHAELNNRSAQGQCFTNMAFAYSQFGDTERAGEFYLHALQAGKDTVDQRAQWQAMEGLGAVAFNEGQYSKAVRYFKMALAVLGGIERNQVAQERIVAKLTDSIKFMTGIEEPERPSGEVNILVNDLPRPPTRDEQRQMEELRTIRKEKRRLRQRQNDFVPIALGVTDYDTDSDISLKHAKRKSRRSKRSNSRLERSSSLSSYRREPEKSISTNTGSRPFQNYAHSDDGLTRRSSSVPNDTVDGRRGQRVRRNFTRPLLRTDSFDSDEERLRVINERRRTSSRGKILQEWLEEDSSDSVSDFEEKQKTIQKMYEEPEAKPARPSLVETTLLQSMKQMEVSGATPMASRPDSVITRSSTEYHSVPNTETETEGGVSYVRPETVSQVAASVEEDLLTETESETDSEEEEEEEEVIKAIDNGTLLPPAPPVPISSPNSTYLQPAAEQSVSKEDSKDEDTKQEQHPARWLGGNFFSPEEVENPEDRTVGDFKQIVKKPEVNTDIDGDPIYQTINSMKSTLPLPDTARSGMSSELEQSDNEAPPLPPRPSFETMTRAEKLGGQNRWEAFLFEYQKKRDENLQERQKRRDSSFSEAALPKKNDKGSKMCIVM